VSWYPALTLTEQAVRGVDADPEACAAEMRVDDPASTGRSSFKVAVSEVTAR